MSLPLMKKTFGIILFFLLGSSNVFGKAEPVSLVKGSSQPEITVISSTTPGTQKARVTLDDLLGKPETLTKSASSGASKVMALSVASSSGVDSGRQNFVKTLSVDTRIGAPVVAVPVNIPEGRGGLSPFMGLSWSPTGGNGPFGWGWAMDMGSVVRSVKNGVPNYNSTDTFLAFLGGKNYELVSLGTNNEYRSKFDDDRMRFFLNSGVWSAKDKSGTTYYFGSRAGSTVSDGGTRVFKWKLDRIQDLLGNVLVVDYAADGSFEVRYGLMVGKNTTSDVNNKANFAYVISALVQSVDRSDVFVDYKPGFAVSERRLISALTISGGGNLIRRYDFVYAISAKTGRSLLKSVAEVGSDGTTSQPVVNLRYNDTEARAYSVNSIIEPLSGDNLWTCTPIMRNNGVDTYGTPLTQSSGSQWGINWSINSKGSLSVSGPQYGSVMCQSTIYLNSNKQINFTAIANNPQNTLSNYIQVDDSALCAINLNCSSQNPNISAVRNGSVYSFQLNKGYHVLKVKASSNYICMGSCFYGSFSFSLNTDLADQVDVMNSSQVVFPQLAADFNGDGKADVATYFSATGTVKVALSSGSGFLPKSTWIDNFGKGAKIVLGDFNSDGRTDMAAYDTVAATVRVAFSDGAKFTDRGVWLSAIVSGADIYAGDLNADGRSDLYLMSKDASGWKAQVATNSGTAFWMGSA
ncbi:MAG: VCBS repeat-containing protein, partial [Candidatus Omnitrophica bacterium]|nr:VCBS repeat-containing protein [Candidatus Omnitrophota bacterium]